MDREKLKAILAAHAQWLQDSSTGKRALLVGADLTGANLTGANLADVNLTGANLIGADLTWARLTRANLTDADLTRANVARVILCGATIDGAVVAPDDVGGPGHILCALTDDEWRMISNGRKHAESEDE